MKKIFTLAILTIVFASCSKENLQNTNDSIIGNETDIKNSQALERNSRNIALIFGDLAYEINSNGNLDKYIEDDYSHEILYTNQVSTSYFDNGDEFVIKNPNNSDSITISNLEDLGNNKFSFDIVSTDGFSYQGALLEDVSARGCTWCVFIPIIADVVETIIDITGDNYDSNCNAAINACSEGVQSITIIDQGWFSAASCTVICK